MARQVFNWVLVASRPLTVEELAEACAFKFGDKQYSDGARRLATDNWKLIFNCNNLVTVDQYNGKDSVRFVHATVLEHLRRKGVVDDDTAYQNAACICLTYLNLTDFESQITRYSPSRTENTCIQSPKEWIPTLISPSQNPPSTALAVEKVSRIRNVRKLKASTLTLPPIDLKNLQAKFLISRTSQELQILERKYKFAEYARQNWIEHCRLPCPWARDILALGLGVDVKFQESIISPSERVSVVWAVRYQHVPLLQLLQARMDPTKWGLILLLPVRDGNTWEAFGNTSSEERDLGPMRDSLIVDATLRSDTRPHYTTDGSGDVTRRSPSTISDDTNWFLIRSCPSLGLSLIIYLKDKARFLMFFQKSTGLDLQRILFQHGPYLVDPIGLILITLSDGQHRPYDYDLISMMEIMLDPTRSGKFAFEPNRPAYRLLDEPTPQKRAPHYLKWALELGFSDVADFLTSVVESYLRTRLMNPNPSRDDYKFVPEESLSLLQEMAALSVSDWRVDFYITRIFPSSEPSELKKTKKKTRKYYDTG
ncbi:hypothetical protein TWF173_011324 [Orbilia oligospora]|nr:hypothetical protein TWF173_011324 [Orbilia oligospora]